MNSQLFVAARSLVQNGRSSAVTNLPSRKFKVSLRSMSSMNKKFAEAQAPFKETGAKNAPKTSEGSGMTTDVRDGIRLITLNRPGKRNAITTEMYTTLTEDLTEANTDDSTKIVVLTGTGDYFCSGNDIGNFEKVTDVMAMAEVVKRTLQCVNLLMCVLL